MMIFYQYFIIFAVSCSSLSLLSMQQQFNEYLSDKKDIIKRIEKVCDLNDEPVTQEEDIVKQELQKLIRDATLNADIHRKFINLTNHYNHNSYAAALDFIYNVIPNKFKEAHRIIICAQDKEEDLSSWKVEHLKKAGIIEDLLFIEDLRESGNKNSVNFDANYRRLSNIAKSYHENFYEILKYSEIVLACPFLLKTFLDIPKSIITHDLLSYSYKNNKENFKFLLNITKINLDTQTNLLRTIIIYKDIDSLKKVLTKKININNTEELPLHHAIYADSEEMVTLLLEHNANPHLENNSQENALTIASKSKNPKMVPLIMQYWDKKNN